MVAIVAVIVTAAVGALAWSPRRPGGVDAWAVHALAVARASFPYRFASRVDDTMRVLGAIALVAWVLLRRWDAVAAALVVAPAAVAAEQSLKLAGRQSLGLNGFTYPSGRVALATSLALLLALVVRAAGVRHVVWALVTSLGTVYVLAMAWARLATGQHLLTDVVGGMSVGVAVTLGTLLALTAWRKGTGDGLLASISLTLGVEGVIVLAGAGDHRRDPKGWEAGTRTIAWSACRATASSDGRRA